MLPRNETEALDEQLQVETVKSTDVYVPLSTIIAPSILAADFGALSDECSRILQQGADWLHVDVMDGHFVPSITIGAPVVASLRKKLGKEAYLDCHLMISDPAGYAEAFAKAGASGYTFHIEAVQQRKGGLDEDPKTVYDPQLAEATTQAARELCARIRELGMKPGIAVKPATPASAVEALLKEGLVDLVLVMTVEPGFGGQKFMPDQLPKVKQLSEWIEKSKYADRIHIQVDGGITVPPGEDPQDGDPALEVGAHGANVIVAGTAVFGAADPTYAMEHIRLAVDGGAIMRSLVSRDPRHAPYINSCGRFEGRGVFTALDFYDHASDPLSEQDRQRHDLITSLPPPPHSPTFFQQPVNPTVSAQNTDDDAVVETQTSQFHTLRTEHVARRFYTDHDMIMDGNKMTVSHLKAHSTTADETATASLTHKQSSLLLSSSNPAPIYYSNVYRLRNEHTSPAPSRIRITSSFPTTHKHVSTQSSFPLVWTVTSAANVINLITLTALAAVTAVFAAAAVVMKTTTGKYVKNKERNSNKFFFRCRMKKSKKEQKK